MSWIEVRAAFSPVPQDWSPIIDIFRDHGIENTIEEKDTLSGCYVDVDGTPNQIEKLKAALLAFGAASVTDGPLVEVDWENAWKQFFKPRRIGGNFVVRPTWEPFDSKPTDHVIVLDPGQAFGTGDHPTTRMCLELLEKYVTPDMQVLDLGCGSGILSIGAKMIGAKRVMGIDIDPIAVDVTRENAELNKVEIESSVGDVLEIRPETGWDLVVSNIISATLIHLSPDAAFSLRDGGIWIVSGIIPQNWNDVAKAAGKQNLTLVEHQETDGWVAGVFRK